MSKIVRNKKRGLDFEKIFHMKAGKLGYLVKKNHLSAYWVPFPVRRLQVVKGELDFKMATREGRVSYLDCKTYNSDHFVYSALDEHQVKRSIEYNDYNIPSGFVVYFMPLDKVVFFSGHTIKKKGARNRFTVEDGLVLGGLVDMRIDLIYEGAIRSQDPSTLKNIVNN